ncbi:MAG: hypothetical protein TREMPRED_005206 [Tremellales sp. Tagirdzhanova-0007]|nr:MAG: hypothetical protein TREMPRED_005206 [Tremellales sp. Tagirdzhanova-0007]
MRRSGKAGISWPCQELTSDPLLKFFQPGSTSLLEQKLCWHYNWNKNWDALLPKTTPDLHIDVEFVPMIFAPEYLEDQYDLQSGASCLLGYNEPDHHDPQVAVQTSVATAAAGWVELSKLRSTRGVKLVSPAVSFDIDWLKSFDPDVPPPQSQQQVHNFMGQATKWLDETDYIIKYAWFGAVRDPENLHGVHPFNRLMDEQGEITSFT